MVDEEYAEYSLTRDKLPIDAARMSEIDAWFEGAGDWLRRLDAVRPTLERLRDGGRYDRILTDPSAGEIVFVNRDGSRFARTPEQIAALFGTAPRNPPALRLVG